MVTSAGSSPVTPEVPRREGVLRRALQRLTSSTDELDAARLAGESENLGGQPIGTCCTGERVRVAGTLRSVSLRPVGGVPALEADLFDGTGALRLIWLGRRHIRGIDAGRRLVAIGRVTAASGRPTMYNPAYELLP